MEVKAESGSVSGRGGGGLADSTEQRKPLTKAPT